MDRSTREAPERGFSLVELAVSMMVLTVGVLAVANVFAGSLHATGLATIRSRAAAIATRELETMRAVPHGDLAVGASSASITENATTFTVERDVEWTAVDAAAQAYKRVQVVVRWTDGGGAHAVRQDAALFPKSVSSSPTTTVAGALPAPLNLVAVLEPDAPDRAVTLSWASPSTPVAWEVQHSLDPGFPPERTVVDTATHPGETATFLVSGLSPATTFYFRVRALGGADVASTWSNVAAVTTAAATATDCLVSGASATPSQVPRTKQTNHLATDVLVEVRTNGACGPLTITFRPEANAAPQRLTPDRSGASGVVEWTIRKSTAWWDLGPKTVTVVDASDVKVADVAFVVCEPERCG